ncbi:hypothetical protein ACXFDM_005056, partial [Escherichia coli]
FLWVYNFSAIPVSQSLWSIKMIFPINYPWRDRKKYNLSLIALNESNLSFVFNDILSITSTHDFRG